MDDLIEALQILKKYLKDENSYSPLHCEHDELTVCDINPKNVSKEDKERLKELGFEVNKRMKCFISYRFGSC